MINSSIIDEKYWLSITIDMNYEYMDQILTRGYYTKI
jgi:hypothetical protein